MVLEVGGRYFDPEVSLAVFPGPEVAQQRQQRADLASLVAEVDSIGEDTALQFPGAPTIDVADRFAHSLMSARSGGEGMPVPDEIRHDQRGEEKEQAEDEKQQPA